MACGRRCPAEKSPPAKGIYQGKLNECNYNLCCSEILSPQCSDAEEALRAAIDVWTSSMPASIAEELNVSGAVFIAVVPLNKLTLEI